MSAYGGCFRSVGAYPYPIDCLLSLMVYRYSNKALSNQAYMNF